MSTKKYTRRVATNMVVANMIGTGIFTSLGYQVADSGIPDPFAIMVIWLLGGVIALCGATVYAEVASSIGKSGGEYAILSKMYHPLLGFISGWISIVVGFSAAIASLAIAAGSYFLPVLGLKAEDSFGGIPPQNLIAVFFVLAVALVQWQGVRIGSVFQNMMTYVKLALIIVFIALPFVFHGSYEASGISFMPDHDSWDTIFSLPFAGSLVWVMFAYSGWNASVYIVGSLENPKKDLPFSLIAGTLLVSVIYLALNSVFMYVATFEELAFQVDLGNVVSVKILGTSFGLIFSVVFSLALISGISAMFIAGPRVAQEIGRDYSLFKELGQESTSGAPKRAIAVIALLSVSLIFLLNFSDLIEYIGVTLSVFSFLTVASVFILRRNKNDHPDAVRSFAYPIAPLVFMSFTCWMIWYFVQMKPLVIAWFLISILPAIVIFYVTKRK